MFNPESLVSISSLKDSPVKSVNLVLSNLFRIRLPSAPSFRSTAILILLFFLCFSPCAFAEKKGKSEASCKSAFSFSVNCNNLFYFYFSVSVSEVDLDSAVSDLQWLGADHTTVICLTTGGHLYRSSDSGKNWSDITDELTESGRKGSVTVSSIIVSPTDKNVLVVVGKKKHHHFLSRDAGASFHELEVKGTVHNFIFHPTRPKWALVSVWSEACRHGKSSEKGAKCSLRSSCNKDTRSISLIVVDLFFCPYRLLYHYY